MAETTQSVQPDPGSGPTAYVTGFEGSYARYSFEREEADRLAASGEAESSFEQVEERHQGLCTIEALAGLRDAAERAPTPIEHHRAELLATACAAGIADQQLAAAADELTNALAAATLEHDGETVALFEALRRLPAIDDFEERERLGREVEDCMAAFEPSKADWHRRYEAIWAEVTGEPDAVVRAERRCGIRFAALEHALARAVDANNELYQHGYRTLLPRLLGAEFEQPPISAQLAYARNLRGLAGTEQFDLVQIVTETLAGAGFDLAGSGIRCDLESRPGKNPRACMFPSDPPEQVYLQALPSGGLLDFILFLHECGHAFHFVGVSPQLPFTLRRLSADYSLTETYAFLFAHITHDPLWHQQAFGVGENEARQRAQGLALGELMGFRLFVAKLRYESLLVRGLDDLAARKADYARLLSDATGLLYRPQRALFDVDDGFYAADYLRAWLGAAQLQEWLEAQIGRPWWRSSRAAELLGELFALGSSPTLEQLSQTMGIDQFDPEPLIRQQQEPFV